MAVSEPRASTWPSGRTWALVAVATLAVVALALAFVTFSGSDGNRDNASVQPAAECEPGVRWQQSASPYLDGTVVGVSASNEVSIIRGGARVGFPSPEEFTAMGFTSYMPISDKDYTAIGAAPRDGLLFRERAFQNGPGRLYYSAGGAVYQVTNAKALERLGVDVNAPIAIPSFGLDGAPRIPKTGTLLRLKGSPGVWIIDGGARRPVRNVCRNARINDLPNEGHVLDEIPATPR